MGEKDTIIKEDVKFGGLFDFKGLYGYIHNWIKDEEFNLTEKLYEEKIDGNAKTLDIKWKASKKITDYFKINLELRWRVIRMSDVEVEIDGKKKKMNKVADLKITLKGILEKDYYGKWSGSPVQKFFKEVYHKYVIPSRTDDMEDKVEDYIKDLNAEIKAFLELSGKR